MPRTVVADADARERRTLAEVCGKPAKAELRPQVPATRLRDVAAEAIRAVGKQSAAASDIGIHEARLSHKVRDGSLTLAQLEALGPAYAAKLGESLVEQFGPLSDPTTRARQQVRVIRQALDEIDAYLDHVA